jgi:3-oxoacyl-[acyl-carrier protein] reductase
MRLKDKVAVVTGGGRGIGQATSLLFAEEGASVMVADIDSTSAEQVEKAIIAKGGKAVFSAVDVTNRASIDAMMSATKTAFGKIDILINNAGINRDTLAIRMKEEQWDLVLDINLKGTFLCCQAVFKYLKDAGGRIINTASIAALGNPGQVNYSASKGGVISLTRTLALEWSRYNINVNSVAPGATMTPMLESVPEDMREKYKAQIPLKRFAHPREIAQAHLFLCSDEASYITGQILFVDGGISVGL